MRIAYFIECCSMENCILPLKSMMHVRDWCVQQFVHLVLFSRCILASREREKCLWFLLFGNWWNLFFFPQRDHVLFWNNFRFAFFVCFRSMWMHKWFCIHTLVVQSNCNLIICDYENQRVIVCESVSNGATVWKRANAKAITRYLFVVVAFLFKPNYSYKIVLFAREQICMYVNEIGFSGQFTSVWGNILTIEMCVHTQTKCKNTNAFNRHQ